VILGHSPIVFLFAIPFLIVFAAILGAIGDPNLYERVRGRARSDDSPTAQGDPNTSAPAWRSDLTSSGLATRAEPPGPACAWVPMTGGATSRRCKKPALAAALLSSVVLAACQRHAVEGPSQIAGGIRFDYGLAPSAQVSQHPADHPEASMHGGPLVEPHAYHITLSLLDAKTGARITDAEVTYEISGPGHPGVGAMPMQPMTVNSAVTYGAYEVLPADAKYRITFTAKRYGPPPTTAKAVFLVARPQEN
jgi:hypothetical protein